MKYWMLQVFLTRRNPGPLFEALSPSEGRRAYLTRAFGSKMVFTYRRQQYFYEPFPSPDKDYICAVIGRPLDRTIVGPPEESFASRDIKDWQTANLIIYVSSDDTGQRVAMQQVQSIGNPLNVFRELADHIEIINRSSEWTITINAITKVNEIWEVVKNNLGYIHEMDLRFATPNVWNGSTETEDALKKLSKENNAQEVEVKIKNKDGKLNPDSANVRESVKYIERGGGSVKIRGEEGGVIYDSEKEENVVTSNPVEDKPIQEADVSYLKKLISWLF